MSAEMLAEENKYAAGTSIKPTLWRYRCPAVGYAGGAGPSSSEGRAGGGTCSDMGAVWVRGACPGQSAWCDSLLMPGSPWRI